MTENNNLPLALTHFIGREKEIAEIKRLIASPPQPSPVRGGGGNTTRLLTLTGAGGAGKTRLAIQVARDLLDAFPDGVWLVELASLADPTLVPQTVASIFDLRPPGNLAPIDLLKNFLRAKNLLLVLDNCEHLIHACAQLAESLLTSCPDLKILATSREALNIAGEITFRVPSLALPNLQALPPLDAFAQVEAIRLFTDRARAAQSDFELTHANAPAIAQICARLDGMPLALELAAARVKTLSVEQIAARLDDRFRLLTTGSRTAPTRQQTLRGAMDWSYDLLSAQEQIALNRLSVFAGGWTLDAAEFVCAEEQGGRGAGEKDSPLLPRAPAPLLDVLSRLVDKSLVMVEIRDGATRYRMLETIRQYAREKLIESGERENVQNRHLEYFVKLADEAEPNLHGAGQMTWFNRLDNEYDNLRNALEWSASEDRVEKGLRLGGALYRFWLTRGYWNEGYQRLDSLLKIKGAEQRTLARGKALQVAGNLARDTKGTGISRRLYEESISILRELGAVGRPALESALGDYGFSLIFHDLAIARSCGEETARLSRESGNILGLAQALIVLGNVARQKCDFASALQCFEESKILYQEIKDKRGVTATFTNLGWTYFNQGNMEKAKEMEEQAITMAREMGNKYHLAGALLRLGINYQVRDQNDQAETLLHQALSAERELGNKPYVALALMHLGRLHLKQGHSAQAYQELRESLGLFKEESAFYFIPHALDSFAFLPAESNHAPRAAQLFGATQALREKFGTPLSPGYRKDYEAYLAAVCAKLDDATFDAAWNEGRAMLLEQAIEFALAEIKIPDAIETPTLSPRQAAKEKFGGLTAREREVAALIARGKSNREIADALVLSERTIEGHVGNILNKLGFNARTQIATWAVEKGLHERDEKP
ncbi:MAG: tetratricopeptide repeat protein [Chloroflexi bacterium]|nr:tetratricopeptide repeat protein [Chloroflexota bacterium]